MCADCVSSHSLTCCMYCLLLTESDSSLYCLSCCALERLEYLTHKGPGSKKRTQPARRTLGIADRELRLRAREP